MSLQVPSDVVVRMIEPELLLQELASGRRIFLVDVRDGEEWSRLGHIAGARHLPLRELRGRRAELSGLEGRSIVVVCGQGRCAREAAAVLALGGFEEVEALEGGMARWIERGFPIESAQDVRRSAISALGRPSGAGHAGRLP